MLYNLTKAGQFLPGQIVEFMMKPAKKPDFFTRLLRLWLLPAVFGIAACPVPALAGDLPAARAFSTVKTPSNDTADAIGFYSKGCLAGAKAMPLSASHWQILRQSRNRYWGHPVMIAFLQNLAGNAAKTGWRGLLIGDIAQPRGGPLPFGHASHQIGLDADIWFKPMPARGLSLREREKIGNSSVLKAKSQELDPKKWSPALTSLLKLAASDPKTDRIFVNPAVKTYLCRNVEGDKAWLGKIRPYWGHNEHFHVRLQCPENAENCRPQAPLPKGNGCDSSLDWWFTAAARAPQTPSSVLTLKSRNGKRARPKAIMVSDLPGPCARLVE
ncbi:MAG: penicillin-insensitive murein endopeptidase [Candidatus Tokpelaia sp.]|nr:MAG: penicillin-insensitive murein endopeptidase [Candidatus Tokpelaia sp.]KAA6207297.1 MAG: penicillin-insensitive murein endopeptidase [Candidatus Tokpelaia sp.]